jgi:hypothetical protein
VNFVDLALRNAVFFSADPDAERRRSARPAPVAGPCGPMPDRD